MISCDECQKKIAAVFDHEGSEGDENLISTHTEHCPECQAFRSDMVRLRQVLVSDPTPAVSLELSHKSMRELEAEGDKGQRPGSEEVTIPRHLPPRYRRLAWMSGLAATFLIISSLVGCFFLGRRVVTLKRELQICQQNLAIAHAEGQRRDERETQQKAIAALILRMAELEDRVKSISPRKVTFVPTGRYELPDGQDDL